MSEIPSIQWFPGHMAKTRRMMASCLPLVDGVVEITDARAPMSGRNPEIKALTGGKPLIIVLNKQDRADESITKAWIDFFERQGLTAFAADCRTGKGFQNFVPAVKKALAPLIEKNAAKGMSGRPVRLMAVGIPNVGKSSFINRAAGTKKTKVEDRPGVTRDKQWVSAGSGIELLDMPGVLWPKFEDMSVGEKLAFTGAVKDDVVDTELLACRLLLKLRVIFPEGLVDRYGIRLETPCEDEMEESGEAAGCVSGYELLCRVGKARGMLLPGGEINTERAAAAVLDEFRGGKLGRITLETPGEYTVSGGECL